MATITFGNGRRVFINEQMNGSEAPAAGAFIQAGELEEQDRKTGAQLFCMAS